MELLTTITLLCSSVADNSYCQNDFLVPLRSSWTITPYKISKTS